MKHFWLIVSFNLCCLHLTFSQSEATLHLEDNVLTGQCDHPYLTGFEIELDTIYSEIDSLVLFDLLPRVGSIHFKNRIHIPTEFTLTERAGNPQLMFRFRTNYYTFDQLQINKQFIHFVIDTDPHVPVTENDLKIIALAKKLLSDEKYWNRDDDRDCMDDLAEKSYSIYCAIRIASLEVENKYNHRNAILQKLRHLIDEKYPIKKWSHRLMDFNNMEEISYSDIMDFLDNIEKQCVVEMSLKKDMN